MDAKRIIDEIRGRLKSKLKHVYFVACGGSQAALFPGMYLLQSEAATFGASIYNSDEFIHATPAMLDENCICILCSLHATAETVEAVKVANTRGAITIAMTGEPSTPMAQNGQYTVVYSNGDDQVYSRANQACVLRLGFELLHQFEGYARYEAAMHSFSKIDAIIARAKEKVNAFGREFAEKYKDETLFYIMASGAMYNAAYTMAYCHLMEMQCRHAICLHDGEYFHGPFETTDEKLPIILMLSEGRTRPLDERCLRFLNKYAANVTVLDIRDYGIGELDSSIVEFFNSVIMIPIERYLVTFLAELRNHPMSTRRYMWKVEY